MTRLRNSISFCMVLLFLLSLFGCSGHSLSSSSLPSLVPSQPEKESIEPYAITPLEEPRGGAMTYEEFFSIERTDTINKKRPQNPDIPLSESYYTDGFFDQAGFVWNTEHELYWSNESETSSVLLYRTPENIMLHHVGSYTIFWIQYIAGQESGGRSLHRMYIPTMQIHTILDFEQSVAFDTFGLDGGISTTEFKFVPGKWYYNDLGLDSTNYMFVYSTLTNQVYMTNYYFDISAVRAEYLPRRNQDMENLKIQEDITGNRLQQHRFL